MDHDVLNGDLSINHTMVDRSAREAVEHRHGREPIGYGVEQAVPEFFAAVMVPLFSLHVVSRDGTLASTAVLIGGLLFLAGRKWACEAARKRWYKHYSNCRRDILEWAKADAAELKRFAGSSSKH